MQRPRRTSEDEIRALLARTTEALDKIVKIRESMEEYIDFSTYSTDKTVRVKKRPGSSRSSSNSSQRTVSSTGSMGKDHDIDPARSTPASSYGSTDVSSLSDDRSSVAIASEGRLTGSSHTRGSHRLPPTSPARDTTTSTSSSASLPPVAPDNISTYEATENDEDDDDDDLDSSISGSMSMTPFKEARLERLKDLEIAYNEGMPREFFHAVCRFLHASLEVKTRHSRFNFYKDTFLGSDAVRQLIFNGYAEDQPTAIRYGNVLVKLGLIEHVSRTDDQLHNSKDNFYRFTKAMRYSSQEETSGATDFATRLSINANNYRDSVLTHESMANVKYEFDEASDEVHCLVTDEALVIIARVLHRVFERKNKLLFYKGHVGCFLGAEAVNVMRELRIATAHIDAVFIGQCLLEEGLIEPIATTLTSFQDKYVFYRLTKMRP